MIVRSENDKIPVDELVDTVVDGFFTIDIFINFISAYEDPDSGLPVTSLKKIASNYISSWLIIDLVSVFPFQFVGEIFFGG